MKKLFMFIMLFSCFTLNYANAFEVMHEQPSREKVEPQNQAFRIMDMQATIERMSRTIPQDQLKMLVSKYVSLKKLYGKNFMLGLGYGHTRFSARSTAIDAFNKVADRRMSEELSGNYEMFTSPLEVQDVNGDWYVIYYGHCGK